MNNKLISGGHINLPYLKSLAIDKVVYSKTLISRSQVATHEEARDIFIKSDLGEVFITRKGFKLVIGD
jgi:hypothetical protein